MITWACHVCGERRPDAMISVHTIPFDIGAGVNATQNFRYCNDRPECCNGVMALTLDTIVPEKPRPLTPPAARSNRQGCVVFLVYLGLAVGWAVTR